MLTLPLPNPNEYIKSHSYKFEPNAIEQHSTLLSMPFTNRTRTGDNITGTYKYSHNSLAILKMAMLQD